MVTFSAKDRRQLIVELLQESGFVRNSELSDRLGVSTVTIRQDLDTLTREGVTQKIHGGAVLAALNGYDMAFSARAELYRDAKRRIGAAAARIAEPGETILLDAGSTTLQIARRLPENAELTVVTCAANIAMEAGGRAGVNVILCGGQYNPRTLSVSGHTAEQVLQQIHGQRLFLGTYGVCLDKGLSDRNFANAQIKRAMIEAAQEVVLVCDSSKFGQSGPVLVAGLEAIGHVVTDEHIPAAYRDYFEGRGVAVDTV